MKAKAVVYWICTVLIAAAMAFAASQYLMRAPALMEAFMHLGYPTYFPTILGVAKLLGAVALLVPGFVLLKEWAYAGYTFTFIGAFISHLSSGDGMKAVAPLAALAVLALSYFTRPANRRISSPGKS